MEDVYHLIGYGINMNDAIQLNVVVVHIQLMVHAESGNENASDDESIKEDEEVAALENDTKKNVDDFVMGTTCDDYEVSWIIIA